MLSTKLSTAALALFGLSATVLAAPNQVSISASADAAIYDDRDGFDVIQELANGAGEHLFAGATTSGNLRRSFLAFDVAGAIPAGATITSASLTLNCSMSAPLSGTQTVTLHKVSSAWAEGPTVPPAPEGIGDPPQTGDVTWTYSTYNTIMWGTLGGDFAGSPSASLAAAGTGAYVWASTSGLVADVQDWLDNPGTNYGWAIIGNEAGTQNARRFDSRSNSTPADRPVLTVEFTPPGLRFCDASDGSLASCPCGNTGNADTGCDVPQLTGGVRLDVVGQVTSPSNLATITGTGFSTMGGPTAILLRSNALDPATPVVFGDGLRCINTSPLVRLAATVAVSGVSTHTFNHGAMAGPGTFYYQIWFRSTPSAYCTPAAFNLSNGFSIDW